LIRHIDNGRFQNSGQTGFNSSRIMLTTDDSIFRSNRFQIVEQRLFGINNNMDTLSVAASGYIRLKIDLMIKIKNGNLVNKSKVLSLLGIFDILKEK
jgi:hypothetical protein